MTEFGSVRHVFELAIHAEYKAGDFYDHLASMFDRHSEVRGFWKAKAREERDHARWLDNLRASVSDEQMNMTTDRDVLERAIHAANAPVEAVLARIRTLQDAYNEANKIEQAETNATFEFLIEHFSDNPDVMLFLREQLHRHVGSMMLDFPVRFGTGTLRRGVVVNNR